MEKEVIKTKTGAVVYKDDYIEGYLEGYMEGCLIAHIKLCLRAFLVGYAEAKSKRDFRAKSFWVELVEMAGNEQWIRGIIGGGLQSLIGEGIISRQEVRDKYKNKEFYYDMACR